MIDKRIVVQLDSKNISKNPKVTKERFESLWKEASNKIKNEAVEIGGYKDTRSFTNAKNSGLISVRMAVSLAITFGVDPFYLTAEKENKGQLTEANLDQFLNVHGFKSLREDKCGIRKKELESYVKGVIGEIDENMIEAINKVSDEELNTLLKSTLIKYKAGNISSDKVDLLKLLLLS